MAIVFCDGFDHYDYNHALDKWDNRYTGFYGETGIAAGSGRFGGNCFYLNDTFGYIMKAFAAQQTMIVGFAYNPTAGYGGNYGILASFNYNGVTNATLWVSPTHELYVTDSTGAIKGTSSVPIRTGLFQYIEWKLTCGASAGTSDVKIQEATVITATGMNTGAAALTNALYIGGTASYVRADYPGNILWDDLVLMDTTGSYCNDFIGDVRVQELFPDDDGYYTQWDRNTGTDGWELVNDAYNAIDDDTTYVHETAVGTKDTYTFPSVTPTAGTVLAVCVNYYAHKIDSGVRKIKSLARLSSTDSNGTEINLGNLYAFWQSYMYQKPGGGDWTISDVNSSEFGQEITV